jgi:hypothetical protein
MAIPSAASGPWKNLQFVINDGKVFKREIKELASCARDERRVLVAAQLGDFSVHLSYLSSIRLTSAAPWA